MKCKNGSPRKTEGRQSRKHTPKRKVSELDDIAAKRRRAQGCSAQRAFRQRKEDTIAALNLQINDLSRTIEDLNASFLALTDELVASGWLEHNPQATKTVQKTIERFIAAARKSHALREDDQAINDCHESSPITTGRPASEVSLDGLYDTSPFGLGEIEVQSMCNAEQCDAAYVTASQPSDFQSLSCELLPPHNNSTFNFIPRLQLSSAMDLVSPTFAQRLHLEAIRCGLRLVCTAEDRSQEFYRVFNQAFDFHTREVIRAYLKKILDENFNKLLEPPPESDVDRSWSEGFSCAWLNASDVARYFRTIGIDFGGSRGIVTVTIRPGSLLARLLNAQRQPAMGLVTPYGDKVKKSTHQHLQHDLAYLSGTAHHNFPATVQDASSFGILARNFAYTARSQYMSQISIDVSRLIQGK